MSEKLSEILRCYSYVDVDGNHFDEIVSQCEALEVENQKLKEQNAENARWAARHKATKEEWGKQLTKAEAEVKRLTALNKSLRLIVK